MGYASWVQEHAQSHKQIVEKLLKKGQTKEQIIDYFDFENMKTAEPNFCPLYKENRKCHDMESLNCYLCSCPNFRYSDKGVQEVDGKTQYSFCSIDSKDGRQGVYGESIHQDCSSCQVPHHRSYVEKHFGPDWAKIMKVCEVEQ